MSGFINGRQYGYLHPGNDGCFVKNIPYQQVAGYPIGIVYIENVNYPMMPGNVVNAGSYDFPVYMKAVTGLKNTQLFEGDPEVADRIIEAARDMVENYGVRAVSSACGFFGNYQKLVSEAIDVPVAMSSMIQIPFILSMLKPPEKVGILSASGDSVTEELLANCGITDMSRLVIKSARETANFANAVVDNSGYFDNSIAREEVVKLSVDMVNENNDIGAILLECSDMPPYAAEIQARTQLPVFDFITLIRWLHSGVAQRPYSGWI